MKNLLTLKFWFAPRPGDLLFSSLVGIAVVAAILLVAAVVFRQMNKRGIHPLYRKTWQSLSTISFTNAVVGLALLFFSYETIPFLSSRLWYLLWVVEIVAWVTVVVRASREIPKLKEQRDAERKLKQYIP